MTLNRRLGRHAAAILLDPRDMQAPDAAPTSGTASGNRDADCIPATTAR
jgi:hypothetical protein